PAIAGFSFRRNQGGARIGGWLRARSREAHAVPPCRRCGQSTRRPHGGSWCRELRRLLYSSGTWLRPTPGLPVCKAHGGADIHARYRTRSGKRHVITLFSRRRKTLPRVVGFSATVH